MKKFILKLLFTIFVVFSMLNSTQANQLNILVIPTKLFSVCDNYFCFPETSEIIAEDVISNLNTYDNFKVIDLASVRNILNNDEVLKNKTKHMLQNYESKDKIDFETLNELSNKIGVQHILLISTYTVTDKTELRRNLWEILEISNAFQIAYPFQFITNSVLVTPNNNVIWSGKYKKTVTDSNDLFISKNQAQATSQLEKIKQYSKYNIAQTISQNINRRLFPKEAKSTNINNPSINQNSTQMQFVPNALDNLIKPQMIKEIEEGHFNTADPNDDFIFTL